MVNSAQNWKPPAGLDRTRPREVRWTAAGVALICVCGVMMVAAVAVFFILTNVADRRAEEARSLRENGRDVNAEVLQVSKTSGEKSAWVEYRFMPEGRAVAYSRRAKIPDRLARTLRAGSSIPVRYDVNSPSLNFPVSAIPDAFSYLVAPLFSGLLILIAVFLVTRIRRQRYLLVEGRPARGVITAHKKASHGATFVYYEFQMLSGSTHKARSEPTNKPPAIGSTVCVVYDSDNPNRQALYPMALVRLA